MMNRAEKNSGGHKRARARCAGTTLFEMLVYVAVLAVIVNVALSAFVMCSRLSAFGTVALDRMAALDEIRAEFEHAVRSSSSICDGVGEYRTGPEHVVVEQPACPEEGRPRRFFVFGILGAEARPEGAGARLSKLVFAEENGALRPDGFETYRVDLASVRFTYDAEVPAAARLVTLELDVADTRATPRGPVLHRFSATPRSLEERS